MSIGRIWLGLLLLILLANTTLSDASSEEILGPIENRVLLPESAGQNRGFNVQLEVARETSAGYLPVRIVIESPVAFSRDRRFVFRFRSEAQLESPHQNGLVVDLPIDVKQGSDSQTLVRYLPKWSAGQAVQLSVYEEDRALDGYSAFLGIDPSRRSRRLTFGRSSTSRRELLSTEYQMDWVFITNDDHAVPGQSPDWIKRFPDRDLEGPALRSGATRSNRSSMTDVVGSDALLQAIGQEDLPRDWRGYQRFDAILIGAKSLTKLSSNQDGVQPIRDWLLNGGSMVVYNAQSGRETLEKLGFSWSDNTRPTAVLRWTIGGWIERLQVRRQQLVLAIQRDEQSLLELKQEMDGLPEKISAMIAEGDSSSQSASSQSASSQSASSQSASSLEKAPSTTEESDRFESSAIESEVGAVGSLENLRRRETEFEASLESTRSRLAEIDESLATPLEQWCERIVVQSVGAGQVLVLQPTDGGELPGEDYRQILEDYFSYHKSPTLRRGVDPLIGDSRFDRWNIPGVAQPPVYTFIGLLAVFVILVGPVAYRWTKKTGRGYLMFAIAPTLAMITTISLFAYGIISDGFGTVARIRQLTWVDGQSGDAGERVRSTYFAGVQPAGGLRFHEDSELMPYFRATGQSWEERDRLEPSFLGKIRFDQRGQHLEASFLPPREQRQFVTHAPRRRVGALELIPGDAEDRSPKIANLFSFPIRRAVVRDERGDYWFVENLEAGGTCDVIALTTTQASARLGDIYNSYRPLSEVRETRSKRKRVGNLIYDVTLDINRYLEISVPVSEGLFEFWLQRHLQTFGEIPKRNFVATADVSSDVIAVEGCDLRASIRYVFGTLR